MTILILIAIVAAAAVLLRPAWISDPAQSHEYVTRYAEDAAVNYGATALVHGQPVAHDVAQTDDDAQIQVRKTANGAASVSSTNAPHLWGIWNANNKRSTAQNRAGTVITRGLCQARVYLPANVALAANDFLFAVPGQTYLTVANVVATSAGAGRSVANLGVPLAIARKVVAADTSAQTVTTYVELIDPLAIECIRVRRDTLTADLPTTPATNFVPLATMMSYGRILGVNMTARVPGVDTTDPLKFALNIVKDPAGTPVSIFTTQPQLGGDASSEDPATYFSTLMDYDADDAVQGVINATNAVFTPGTRLGYSLDVTLTTPDTAVADILIEVWVQHYRR